MRHSRRAYPTVASLKGVDEEMRIWRILDAVHVQGELTQAPYGATTNRQLSEAASDASIV